MVVVRKFSNLYSLNEFLSEEHFKAHCKYIDIKIERKGKGSIPKVYYLLVYETDQDVQQEDYGE